MISKKTIKLTLFLTFLPFWLSSCGTGVDAKKYPPNPELRVKKNIEEGRGFNLNKAINKNTSTNFEFASSNELWRASLDVIDFMPLTSVNYSGGIIITDWYSNEEKQNESIKITIRFLTNEIRSDSLSIKVFTRKCEESLMNCKYLESNNVLVTELKKEILKKATIYKKEKETKKE